MHGGVNKIALGVNESQYVSDINHARELLVPVRVMHLETDTTEIALSSSSGNRNGLPELNWVIHT
jgi:hypothetical protein